MRKLASLPLPRLPGGPTFVLSLDEAKQEIALTFMGRGLWADPRQRIEAFPASHLRDLAATVTAAADALDPAS